MIANFSMSAFLSSTLLGILLGILFACIIVALIFLVQTSAKRKARIKTAIQRRFTPDAETSWNQLHELIQRELAGLQESDWAGAYYHGDGLGVNATLTIAPRNGFAFIWLGCLGVYDRNYGSVAVSTRGIIQLSCEFEIGHKGYRELAQELVPISWGDRRYLVPPNKISQFRRDVKAGREPRKCAHGHYFLRLGDHVKAVTGLPKMPAIFED